MMIPRSPFSFLYPHKQCSGKCIHCGSNQSSLISIREYDWARAVVQLSLSLLQLRLCKSVCLGLGLWLPSILLFPSGSTSRVKHQQRISTKRSEEYKSVQCVKGSHVTVGLIHICIWTSSYISGKTDVKWQRDSR